MKTYRFSLALLALIALPAFAGDEIFSDGFECGAIYPWSPAVQFLSTATTSVPGYVEAAEVNAGDVDDVHSSLMIEAGFVVDSFTPWGQHSAIVDHGDSWRVGIDCQTDTLCFWYESAGGPKKVDSGVVPVLGKRYQIVARWTGWVLTLSIDGIQTAPGVVEPQPPISGGPKIWLGGSWASPFLGLPFYGSVDYARVWHDYIPAPGEAPQNQRVEDAFQPSVLLELLLTEGEGMTTADLDRGIIANLGFGRAVWTGPHLCQP